MTITNPYALYVNSGASNFASTGTRDGVSMRGALGSNSYSVLRVNSGYNTGGGGSLITAGNNSTTMFTLDNSGQVTTYGNIGVGTAATNDAALRVNSGGNTTAATGYGVLANTSVSSSTTTAFYSGYFRPMSSDINPTIANTYGVYVGGPSTFAGGLQPTYTNLTGLHVENYGRAGSTTSFGLYLENQTGATNSYAVYSAGGTAYFAGNVGIGTTAPAATLDVNGYLKLKKNASSPAACSATTDGSIAMTNTRQLCVCDGSSWTNLVSGAACAW